MALKTLKPYTEGETKLKTLKPLGQKVDTTPPQEFFSGLRERLYTPKTPFFEAPPVEEAREFGVTDILKSGVRPIANLALKPVRDVESILGETSASIEEMRKMGPEAEQAFRRALPIEVGKEAVSLLSKPLTAIGNTALGAIQALIKNTTGVDVGDKEAEKSFDKLKEYVANPGDTAEKVLYSVYKISQESPEAIPLIIEAGSTAYSKLTGKPKVDVISKIAEPEIKAVKATGEFVKSVVEKPIQYVQSKIRASMQADVDKVLSSTKSLQRQTQLAKSKNVDLAKNLSEEDVYRGLEVKDRRIVPDKAIETIDSKIENVLNAKKQILPEVDRVMPKTPKTQIVQRAEDWINQSKLTPADKTTALARLAKQARALPDEMTNVEMDAFRASFRQAARDARGFMKPGDEYSALETAFRDQVFANTDKLPFDMAGDMAKINDYVKNMINTKEFLDKNLRGQVVSGGKLGTYSGRLVGALAGSQGGPFTAIIGSKLGAQVADILINNQLGSSAKMLLIRGITQNTEAINMAEKLLSHAKQYTPSFEQLPVGTSKLGPDVAYPQSSGGSTVGGLRQRVRPDFTEDIAASQKAVGIKPEPIKALPAPGQTSIQLPEKTTGLTSRAVDSFQKNAIAQLKYRGMDDIAFTLKEIDLSSIRSIEQLQQALTSELGIWAGIEEIQNWVKTVAKMK